MNVSIYTSTHPNVFLVWSLAKGQIYCTPSCSLVIAMKLKSFMQPPYCSHCTKYP